MLSSLHVCNQQLVGADQSSFCQVEVLLIYPQTQSRQKSVKLTHVCSSASCLPFLELRWMSSCLKHALLSPNSPSIPAEGTTYIWYILISSQTTAACSPSFSLLSTYYIVFSGWRLFELRFDLSLHTSQQASRCFQITSSLLAPWSTLISVVHPSDPHLAVSEQEPAGTVNSHAKLTDFLHPL